VASKLNPCANLICQALVAEGVTEVFGITGSHVIDLFQSLHREPAINITTARHEGGAAFMAMAYAKTSCKVGVCVTTAGPGVFNALNGLAQAQFSAIPLICISGGLPTGAASFELHGLERENYCVKTLAPVVKKGVRALSIAHLSDELSNAFRLARSGRPGPVYIEVPWNLFNLPDRHESTTYVCQKPKLALFSSGWVDDLYNLLSSTNPIAIVLDKGMLGSPAMPSLLCIAENCNAAITVTRDALGLVAENHPCYIGVLHEHQFGVFASRALGEASVSIGFGFDSGSNNQQLVNSASGGIVHFVECLNSEDTGGGNPITLVEVIGLVYERLITKRGNHASPLSEETRRAKSVKLMRKSLSEYASHKPVHFGYALMVLAKYLSKDSITLLDAGSHEVWGRSVLPVVNELSFVGGNDWASMGFAIPATVGVRVAFPNRRLICLTGDGCLLMSLSDLSTLIQAGGPTLIVNLNDSEYGMMSKVQVERFGRVDGTTLPDMDFARVACELGASACRVENPCELNEVFARALDSDIPYFVDVICDGSSDYPKYD